jgi:hypothetical protein
MKSLLLFLAMTIILSTNSHAQNGFVSSTHTLEVIENDLKIYQTVIFDYGSSAIACPQIALYEFEIENSIVTLELFYDTRGIWQQEHCERTDTFPKTLLSGNYTLIVNCNLIELDLVSYDSITTLYDSDTSFNISVSKPNFQTDNTINIYPNPTDLKIMIEAPSTVDIEMIELYSPQGKLLRKYFYNFHALDIAIFKAGQYFLRITTKHNVITKKVLIE